MADFKEISDLGIESSQAYAQYDQIKNTSNLDQANLIRSKTQLDTNKPSFVSNYSLLFELEEKNRPFGETAPPANFFQMQNRAFVYNLIPSIGGKDQIALKLDSLEQIGQTLNQVSDERQLEDFHRLKGFMETYQRLEEDFTLVEMEKNRFHKA
jgi:hypothetical protein